MSKKYDIDFYTDRVFVGEFCLPDETKHAGKLVYSKNNEIYLELITDGCLEKPNRIDKGKKVYKLFADNDLKFDYIYASCFLDNDLNKNRIFYITLQNCYYVQQRYGDFNKHIYKIYFDNALISSKRNFDLKEENIKSIAFSFNTWPEFCYPQGFSNQAEFKSEKAIKINTTTSIIFNQKISGKFITNNVFDSVFYSSRLKEDDKKHLNNELQKILLPYKYDINIKNNNSHEWQILRKGNVNLKKITNITFCFQTLLACLTNDFNTSIQKIELYSKLKDEKFKSCFYILNNTKISENNILYHHQFAPFQKDTFNKEEWEVIFKNLFNKEKNEVLGKFFFVLQENYSNKVFNPFNVVRYIDCLSAISNYKQIQSKKQYQGVIESYIKDLDVNSKNAIYKFLKNKIDYIRIPDKHKNKKKWSRLGVKISELRATAVHFADVQNKIDMNKSYSLNKFFELIIVDFIFDLLEISEDKRKKYRNHYLINQIPNFPKGKK